MPRTARTAGQGGEERTTRPAPEGDGVRVVYAAEHDPATADRVVELFRRLLARAAKR